MQASFFLTYVLSSGWASLSCEVMQIFPLTCNIIRRGILRIKNEPFYETLSFPYHTEVPRILLFGFLGFTCCILAPLITPFLLFYFFLAYLVYKNQVSSASLHWITCFSCSKWLLPNNIISLRLSTSTYPNTKPGDNFGPLLTTQPSLLW